MSDVTPPAPSLPEKPKKSKTGWIVGIAIALVVVIVAVVLVAGVLAPMLWGSVLSLAAGQLAFAVLALLLWLAVGPYHRRAQMVLE